MIKKIPDAAIVSIKKESNNSLPTSIDSICPNCGRMVNFNTTTFVRSDVLLHTKSRCSGCSHYSIFIIVDFEQKNEDSQINGELYIYPAPKVRQPLYGIETIEKFSKDGLDKAYNSTINVYNSREWTATSVLARRLLEGITKTSLPDSEQNDSLFKQLQKLPNHIDLQKPIITLADAIRKGGNLGAHFDLEKEPNEKVATLMVDLLDYLIEYLFILPNRISELHQTIEDLSKSN